LTQKARTARNESNRLLSYKFLVTDPWELLQ
jgi:hypothetical protein